MAITVTRGRRGLAALVAPGLTTLALIVAACGASGPTPAPTLAPTPVVTPNPHLGDPASAQDVFNGLGRAGLSITPNTASAGSDDGPIVTRIFATYLGWPLGLTEYRTSAALAKAVAWKPGEAPGRGEHPIAVAGANILVTWGPATSGVKPGKPDGRQAEGLRELVAALDLLLAPLRARTTVAVSISAPIASAPTASAPSAPAPSASAKATPAP
jgi:hypothetical protein